MRGCEGSSWRIAPCIYLCGEQTNSGLVAVTRAIEMCFRLIFNYEYSQNVASLVQMKMVWTEDAGVWAAWTQEVFMDVVMMTWSPLMWNRLRWSQKIQLSPSCVGVCRTCPSSAVNASQMIFFFCFVCVFAWSCSMASAAADWTRQHCKEGMSTCFQMTEN